MIFIKDKEGTVNAVAYLVWDEKSIYYLMSGHNTELKNNNFNTLAAWEAIKFASKINKVFDFEGSMIPSISEFFRKFGPVQKTYFNISKDYTRMSVFKKFTKDMLSSHIERNK